MARESQISLIVVSEEMLDDLIRVAVHDAAAADVTPPLTPGENWTPERIRWFEEYHRASRSGLDGRSREAAWAVVVAGVPVGVVRLKRGERPDIAEAGIWLGRNARGGRVAIAAMQGLMDKAKGAGIATIRAETTTGNEPAQALMRRLGFVITTTGEHVHGELELTERELG